jgi:TRAP-type transport system periplasmic protein
MRPARRALLASAMLSVAAPTIMRRAFADAPQFTLKLHHAFSSVSSVHERFLAPWARQVQDQSGGRIRIDIFPGMQLGGAPAALFDQARDGLAEIVWAAPRQTPGRFPKIELFELPFVPSRRALVNSKAIQDYAQDNLIDEFREVHPICFSCSDRGVVHTNRPIHTVEDIGGLRLHVQTRFAADALRALGALPVPMPSEELPMAITQHVVDGCVDPWDMVPALRLGDLLKVHTEFAESSLSTTTFVLAMNKAAYDRLPRDLKAVIDDNSGQLGAGMAGTMWDLKAAAVADLVSQRGDPIVTLLPEAVAHWRKATAPVIEVWLKDMKEHKVDGGKLLAGAQALLAKYADLPEPQPPQPPQAPQTAQAKADSNSPAKPDGASAPSTGTTSAPRVSVATPASTGAPPSASGQPAPWWQFWKSASAPASAPVAPPASATASAVPPSAQPASWWQFWKSASAPASAPVAPPASATASAVPPSAQPAPWWQFWNSAAAPASAPVPAPATAAPTVPSAPLPTPAVLPAPAPTAATAAPAPAPPPPIKSLDIPL